MTDKAFEGLKNLNNNNNTLNTTETSNNGSLSNLNIHYELHKAILDYNLSSYTIKTLSLP